MDKINQNRHGGNRRGVKSYLLIFFTSIIIYLFIYLLLYLLLLCNINYIELSTRKI